MEKMEAKAAALVARAAAIRSRGVRGGAGATGTLYTIAILRPRSARMHLFHLVVFSIVYRRYPLT